MKEIRFRAWGTFEKKFIYSNWKYGMVSFWDTALNNFNKEYEPVQQFTGLLDSNGKEIYEGDILKYFDEVGVVKYSFYELHKSYIPCWCACRKVLTIDDKQRVVVDAEVVGNIYETPELIDAKTLTK